MVDPFFGAIAWGALGQKLAEKALDKVLPELPGKLRRLIQGDVKVRSALRDAFSAGFEAALKTMTAPTPERAERYTGILANFLETPEVAAELAKFVDLRNVAGDPEAIVDINLLSTEFAKMYPVKEYPDAYTGFNIEAALRAFVEGYSQAIQHQPDKLPWIEIGYLRALLDELRKIFGEVHAPQARVGLVQEQALRAYLTWLRDGLKYLPLRGVDVGLSDPSSQQQGLELAQVYVDMDTTTDAPSGGRRTHAPEAVAVNRHVVLLGAPGCGKSTLVHHLAVCLCGHRLEPTYGWITRISGWPTDEAPVPIVVTLRDFARWMRNETTSETRHVWEFLESGLAKERLENVADSLNSALDRGEAFVLFDGMDEIAALPQRKQVRDAIVKFMERYRTCRFVVTCRTLAYQDQEWQLPGVPDFELAVFDEPKIRAFIRAWYAELSRLGRVSGDEGTNLATQLSTAIGRPDFRSLAQYPLLLTVMAMIHFHNTRLPEARALLYEEAVEMLLWRWERMKSGGSEEARLLTLLQDANRSELDLKRVLWEVAYQVHGSISGVDDSVTDIQEQQLTKALVALTPTKKDHNWASEVVDQMRERAGLLIERQAGLFCFPHRTFQEYLAGAHLGARGSFATTAVELFKKSPIWREVILLAVGRHVHISGDLDKPMALVASLCAADGSDDLVRRQAWFAGDVMAEIGPVRAMDHALGKSLMQTVLTRLDELAQHDKLTDAERVLVARTRDELEAHRPGN